jgi:hypothetical protein
LATTVNHRLGSFGGTQHFAGIGIDFNLTNGTHRVKMKAGMKASNCQTVRSST